MITCVYDVTQKNASVYFNGVLNYSTGTVAGYNNGAGPTWAQATIIGSANSGAATYFDEWSVYNYTLSPTEIASLYANNYVAAGAGGANSTQYVNITSLNNGGGIKHYNGTHFNSAFNISVQAISGIGTSWAAVFLKNTTGGGYYVFENITTGWNNNTQNTSNWTGAAGQYGVCAYAIVYSTNGTATYSNATDCDYMFFYDTTGPTLTIATPASGGTYTRGSSVNYNATCNDTYLLNCTLEFYYANGTRASYQNQDFAAGNQTGYYNTTLNTNAVASMYANLSAFDMHTLDALDSSYTFKANEVDSKTGAVTLEAKEADFKATDIKMDSVSFSKLTDRYEYTYKFKEAKTTFSETIKADSPITIVGDKSPYPCHLVFGRSWWDAEKAVKEQGWECKVVRISASEVRIDYTNAKGLTSLDPATGGLSFSSSNISYSVVNYTTLTFAPHLNSTSTGLNTIEVTANYTYANLTAIPSPTCSLIVTSGGANSTYSMNSTGQFNYNITVPGTTTFHTDCVGAWADPGHNETSIYADGFLLHVYNEQNNSAALTFNMTMTNSSGCSLYREITNAATGFSWSNTTGGICTGSIAVSLTSSGYVGRTYYYSFGTGSGINATGYLIPTGNGVYIYFLVLDGSMNSIEDARITMYRSFDGGTTWTEVAQMDTDSFGLSSFYVDASTTYYTTVYKSGYATSTTTVTPISGQTYIIMLGAATTTDLWQNGKVMASLRPSSGQVSRGDNITGQVENYEGNLTNFTMSVYATNNSLIWTRTVTGSPYGGFINYNTSDAWYPSTPNERLIITLSWEYNGTDPWIANWTVYGRDTLLNGTGMLEAIRGIENSLNVTGNNATGLEKSALENQEMALMIISLIVITFVTASMSLRFGMGAGVVGIALTGMFVWLGWLEPVIGIIAMLVAGLAYASKNWG